MRRVLVDHARRRLAGKRGGQNQGPFELKDELALTPQESTDVLALHEALEELERLDVRQAQMEEMVYLSGNSVEEIAGLQAAARIVA